MGVNEIHDGRDSLLTVRMENLRKVQKREGEAGGGGREFQQLFEFAEKEDKDENEKTHTQSAVHNTDNPPLPAHAPRVITPEDIEEVKKRNETGPGQLIDLEA